MEIRESTAADLDGIKKLLFEAFDDEESDAISDFTLTMLREKAAIKTLSFVAVEGDRVLAHIALSPVVYEDSKEHFAYILAPLSVIPTHQKKGIGSKMIRHALDITLTLGSYMVFVYGDPHYYTRFGFDSSLAHDFIPPHPLEYPEGWHALKSGVSCSLRAGKISCIAALNNPKLW